jgi:hypothetical protein
MSYLFLLIGIIIGGIVDRYIMPIFDLVLKQFVNNKHLQTQKKQREINNVENEMSLEALEAEYEGVLINKDIYDVKMEMQKTNTNVIGFQTGEEEYPEDWDDDDCDEDCDCKSPAVECKYNNKIGF